MSRKIESKKKRNPVLESRMKKVEKRK